MSGGTYYIDYNDRFPSQFPEQSASVVIYKPRYQPDVIIAKVQSDSHMGYEELTRGVAGKDDEDVINAANDFVKENGGSIFLRAGTYDVLDVYINTGLIGEAGTVLTGTVHAYDNVQIHNVNIISSEDVIGLRVEGENVTVGNCTISTGGHGIVTLDTDPKPNTIVYNTTITAELITYALGDYAKLLNCNIKCTSPPSFPNSGEYSVISNCVFKGCALRVEANSKFIGNYTDSTIFVTGTNAIVSNNTINSPATPHITGVSDGCVITNNVHINTTTNTLEAVAVNTTTVPTNVVIKDYIMVGSFKPLYSENVFTASVAGDGTTTAFNFAHNLFNTPTKIIVHPNTSADVMPDSVTADATNVTLSFTTAPAAGTTYNYTIYAEV